MFTGCGTALVTPFRKDGSLDEAAMRRLVKRQIDGGIDFLVPCGTTGESPTLTRAEHLRVVEITVEEAKKASRRVPVIGGAGGYSTQEVIELGREVAHLGVDGILSVAPYYNKPTQEGLYQHFKAIAEAVHLPIIVYNIQGRTGINIETATLKRIAEIENIAGVKEASGNISQMAAVCHHLLEKYADRFSVLSGDDAITIPLVSLGGRGLISVVANQIPGEMTQITQAAMRGDYVTARQLQRVWHPLMEVNFVESNPIPVKWSMAQMGLLESTYRLPMCAPLPASQAKIEAVMKIVGLTPQAVTA